MTLYRFTTETSMEFSTKDVLIWFALTPEEWAEYSPEDKDQALLDFCINNEPDDYDTDLETIEEDEW